MKKTDWIDVIGKIDPAYVKEAEQWSKAAQKKRNLRHFTAMAACVCILLAGAVVSFDLWVQNKDTGAETEKCCRRRDERRYISSKRGERNCSGKGGRGTDRECGVRIFCRYRREDHDQRGQ